MDHVDEADLPEWVWCVVANVRPNTLIEDDGILRVVHGTRHFSMGTRLYLYPPDTFLDCDSAVVLGRRRGSNKLSRIALNLRYMENFRVSRTYDKRVVSSLVYGRPVPPAPGDAHGRTEGLEFYKSREQAEKFCEYLLKRGLELVERESLRTVLYGVGHRTGGSLAIDAPTALTPPEAESLFGGALAAFVGARLEGVFSPWDSEARSWDYAAGAMLVTDRGHVAVTAAPSGGVALGFSTVDLSCEIRSLEEGGAGALYWRRHDCSAAAQNRPIGGFSWYGGTGGRPLTLELPMGEAGTLSLTLTCDHVVPSFSCAPGYRQPEQRPWPQEGSDLAWQALVGVPELDPPCDFGQVDEVVVECLSDEGHEALFRYAPEGHAEHAGAFAIDRRNFAPRVVRRHTGDYGNEYLCKAAWRAVCSMMLGNPHPSFTATWAG